MSSDEIIYVLGVDCAEDGGMEIYGFETDAEKAFAFIEEDAGRCFVRARKKLSR